MLCGIIVKKIMNHYLVITPQYETIYFDYTLSDYGSDVVTIWANNKHDARIFACRTKEFKHWVKNQRNDNKCPYTGLKVENTQCKHKKCYCDKCNQFCDECEDEINEQWEKENL